SYLYECEYRLFHVFYITNQTFDQLHLATERMGKIFLKTARLLRNLSDEQLLDLGFPSPRLSFIRMKGLYPESVFSRFDFALTEDN
ncbi:glutathionylspermidine synthase family protein, partial [Bacillus cereus]|nr:glutathionylspermidine synthase family protein [Bacillus cereus]